MKNSFILFRIYFSKAFIKIIEVFFCASNLSLKNFFFFLFKSSVNLQTLNSTLNVISKWNLSQKLIQRFLSINYYLKN
jgi:hypothetical protein